MPILWPNIYGRCPPFGFSSQTVMVLVSQALCLIVNIQVEELLILRMEINQFQNLLIIFTLCSIWKKLMLLHTYMLLSVYIIFIIWFILIPILACKHICVNESSCVLYQTTLLEGSPGFLSPLARLDFLDQKIETFFLPSFVMKIKPTTPIYFFYPFVSLYNFGIECSI